MPEPDDGQPQPYRALIGLLVIIAVIGMVLFITYRLREAGSIQDCVASGRTNCAPIAAPPRQ